jgi:protein-S-isoprenylcysteine O-methyltransferase Ste14
MVEKLLASAFFFLYLGFRFLQLSSKDCEGSKWTRYYNWNLPLMICAYLLVVLISFLEFVFNSSYVFGIQQIISLTVFLTGVVLSNYARKILGSFHQSKISLCDNHDLVTTDLYRVLRHPYLLGVFLEVLSITLFFGSKYGLLVFAIVYVPLLWLRSKLEDNILDKRFGEKFKDYKKKVPAFVPFVK